MHYTSRLTVTGDATQSEEGVVLLRGNVGTQAFGEDTGETGRAVKAIPLRPEEAT